MKKNRTVVALISPEIAPWASTGGLGEMVGSLGQALAGRHLEVVLILPAYRCVPAGGSRSLPLPESAGTPPMIAKIRRISEDLTALFLDCPQFFDRPRIYGEKGGDYPDNAARFAAFCRGTLAALKTLSIRADILHAHDWQAALIPFLLRTACAQDPFFEGTRTVLTIHNLGYQGLFSRDDLKPAGLEERFFTPRLLEFHGRVNFLKAGLVAADALTTVSPSYAREILTPEFGFGLEGVLKDRKEDLTGLLNGIDTEAWGPATRPESKESLKRALQRELVLPEREGTPLAAVIARLVPQKGVDAAIEAVRKWISRDVQWVFLGEGDPGLEEDLRRLARENPNRVAARIAYDADLARRILGGADLVLMPSRYEPCGTVQMYAQRCGTIPVVRAVGGLRDTVTDADEDPERGTGFVYDGDRETLAAAIGRALERFRNAEDWSRIQRRAMERDFSWTRSADAFERLYEEISRRGSRSIPDAEFSPTS